MNKIKKKYSLRLLIAIHSIAALCIACCGSLTIVLLLMKAFYHGEYTAELVCIGMVLCCFLAIVLGVVILWAVAGKITKPIIDVADAADEIARGNFDVRIACKRNDEIGKMALHFNTMVDELNRMEYMNKDFISNVSHEIKTPVAVMTSLSEVLMDGGQEEAKRKEYIRKLYEESIWINKLCDNMLRISRLDHQKGLLKCSSFDVSEQIRHCIILLSEKWEAKEIEFQLDLLPYQVNNDYDLLCQVWLNLIENAIKFSQPKKQIKIAVIPDGESVWVKIQDEGIGIQQEKINRIFERFYQCEESHGKQGHGLGLSIVKRIVELFHGTITCQSELSVGTTFEVMLPQTSKEET